MSQPRDDQHPDERPEQHPGGPDGPDLAAERGDIAAVAEELDARSEGEGLAAEAGRGEETGLSEG